MNKINFNVAIGNKLIKKSSHSISIHSPINNKIIGIIPSISSQKQIDDIFINAKKTFEWWKDFNLKEKIKMLKKFILLIKKNKNFIIELLINEIAKNKKDSINEIERSIEYIEQTICTYLEIINNPLIIDDNIHKIKNKVGKFIYQPLGVVLAISPFNYPINLLISKIVPALISGNCVVYKPATQGSCIGAYISELLFESGFNKGQVSCIIGRGKDIGDLIIKNPNIDMISFTGSPNIGKKIANLNPMKHIVLELGGKDPAIVLDDANLELCSNEIIKGAFNYNGQRCTAIKRVLVSKKNHQKLVNLLNNKLSKLKVGSVLNDCNITELISKKSVEHNLDLINDALKNGAKSEQIIKIKNNILWPMILDNVSLKMKIAWEESFGPILPIIEFESIDEAIKIANQSEYGLQASIFTKNHKIANEIAMKLECGTVNINRSSSRGPDVFPFSGIKNSGFGVQGIKDAILSMNKIKGIVFN